MNEDTEPQQGSQPNVSGPRRCALAIMPKTVPTITLIKSDLKANRRNPKGIVIAVLYRIAHGVLFYPLLLKPAGYIIIAFYKIITEYILGSEIHWRSTFGPRLQIFHGYNLVVHSGAVIGKNCTLRHGVTIGAKDSEGKLVPSIGDNVEFGVGAIVIGAVNIGNNVKIGAGAVIVKDVPEGSIVVGNPGRIISYEGS